MNILFQLLLILGQEECRAREKGTNRETRTSSMKDSAQEKVPVTQTLSFCQMHFLSPLPVAFDRKLVSVIPVTVGRARQPGIT